MKLLLTIVQDADVGRLQSALSEAGFQLTKLASTGGFLREANTTLLVGVEDEEVEEVTGIIHDTCRERTRVIPGGSPLHAPEATFAGPPVEVPVVGAIVIVLKLDSVQWLEQSRRHRSTQTG